MGKPQQASLNHTLAGATPLPSSSLHPHAHSDASEDDHDRSSALLDLAIGLVESALEILLHHLENDEQMRKESRLMPGGTLGKHFRHVIETYQAFLLPLDPLHRPTTTTSPTQSTHSPPSSSSSRPRTLAHSDLVVINYDAILPTSRRPIARSRTTCAQAMQEVRDGLVRWGRACRARLGAEKGMRVWEAHGVREDDGGVSEQNSGGMRGMGPGVGLGGAGEVKGHGIADEFDRPVELVAITPTRQEMRSSVGRELWFCSLHAIHHFSMLRTIAVHELGLKLPVEFGTAPSTLLYRGSDWAPSSKVGGNSSGQRTRAKL